MNVYQSSFYSIYCSGTAGLRQSTSDVVYEAINSGVYLIDTAQAREWYSEELVGQGLEMFLANEQNKKGTKFD